MEESVLLGTKPLVDSIRHFIPDPSGVFSVCHLCECRIGRIVHWRHDSRLLLLLNFSLHIIKKNYTLTRRYEFYVLVARTTSHSFIVLTREILFLPHKHKIHIFSPPCNILYIHARHVLSQSNYLWQPSSPFQAGGGAGGGVRTNPPNPPMPTGLTVIQIQLGNLHVYGSGLDR